MQSSCGTMNDMRSDRTSDQPEASSPADDDQGSSDPAGAGLAGLGRSALWSYAGTVGGLVGSLGVLAVTARELGLAALGVYGAAGVILALLTTMDFGLAQNVVRAAAAAGGPDAAAGEPDIAAAQACYLALGCGVVLLSVPLALLLTTVIKIPSQLHQQAFVTFVLMALATGVAFATAVPQGLAAGQGRYDVVARATLAGAAVNLIVVLTLIGQLELPALGVGQLAGVVVSRGLLRRHVARSLPGWRWRPTRQPLASYRRVVSLGLPVLVLAAAVQVVTAADTLIVGALSGAASLGAFRLGVLLPTQATGVLLQGYDTVLPVLSRSARRLQTTATISLTRLALFIGSLGLGVLVIWREAVVTALSGHPNSTAQVVLVLTAVACLANVAIHGWALMLIARSIPHVLLPFVCAETVANVALTGLLVPAWGPEGAAVATLLALGTSNLLVLPILLGRRGLVTAPVRRVAGDLLCFGGAGWAVAAAASGLSAIFLDGRTAALLAGLLAAPAGALLLWCGAGGEGRAMLTSMARSRPSDAASAPC